MYRYVRTNMTTGNVRVFALPRDRWVLGGRGLISRVLYTEMDPSSDPLGPKNVLVLASGIFAGCPLSCFDEVFFGAKSPSTGRLESVRFMSRAARLMASMDIRLAIFEGQAPEGKQYVLLMDRGSASLLPLEEYEATPDEMGGYALHDALQRQFGKNACIVSWGHPAVVHSPGASLLVSGVSGGHLKNIPGRGISAVMASKGLRAIVLRSGASLSSMYTRGKKQTPSAATRSACSAAPGSITGWKIRHTVRRISATPVWSSLLRSRLWKRPAQISACIPPFFLPMFFL